MLSFVPVASWRAAPDSVRAVLAAAIAIALFAHLPESTTSDLTIAGLAIRMVAEAASGLAVGVTVSLLLETFSLGAQLVAVQAGYSYASTVDPTSQADSNVLQALAQLLASLLFLHSGLDRLLLRALVSPSPLRHWDSHFPSWQDWSRIQDLGTAIWSAAFRLALPLLVLLLATDVALSCLGKINSHLQLLAVAFPAKILLTLGLLAMLTVTVPYLFQQQAARFITALGVR